MALSYLFLDQKQGCQDSHVSDLSNPHGLLTYVLFLSTSAIVLGPPFLEPSEALTMNGPSSVVQCTASTALLTWY